MDFHEDTPVFRPPATSLSGHVFEVHLWILKPPAFLFYSDTSCSTDVCPPALVFPTKAKYQRHWSENHLPEVVSYSCPVYLCKIDCRQRYDMKVHLLRVSNTANGLVGSIFSKSQRILGRIDPSSTLAGMFIFYGRTSSTADKDVPQMSLVEESLESPAKRGLTVSASYCRPRPH